MRRPISPTGDFTALCGKLTRTGRSQRDALANGLLLLGRHAVSFCLEFQLKNYKGVLGCWCDPSRLTRSVVLTSRFQLAQRIESG